jgi:hypothetical protein
MTCSSSRGIITHLSNALGMLANHPVIAVGSEAFGWLGCQRTGGRRSCVEGGNLDIARGFRANAEVSEIAGSRRTEHPEVNR